MKIRASRILAAAAVQGLLAVPLMADPTVQEISDKMAALQAQLSQLKSQQQQVIAQQQKQELMQDVLLDAQTRSSLEGSGLSAGYKDRRFYIIGSEDGNFLLRPWIHIQFRDSTVWRDDVQGNTSSTLDGADDVQNGFELRRARLGFDGNLFTPDLTYYINWSTLRASQTVNASTTTGAGSSPKLVIPNNVGGLPVLEEAWIKYHFADTPWAVRVGQMHDPLSHENITGSKYIAPERSLQGDLFENVDTFVQGVTAIYDPKSWFRIEGGWTDGIYSANTSFQDAEINDLILYNWGAAGRAEFKAMGNWKDYDQFTALGDSENLLVFGVGADYSQGDNAAASHGTFGQFTHVADVHFATPGGIFIYGSYLGRYITNSQGIPLGTSTSAALSGTATGHDTYEPSFLIQAAYLFDQKIEPYVRYEYMHFQGTAAGSQNNVHEVSLGTNYYFYRHNLKLTGQVMYLPNGIPINDTSNDILADNAHAEVVAMLQLQLLL